MNTTKLVLTIIVVFVVANLTGFFIHAVLLRPEYMAVKEHYRPEGQEMMLWLPGIPRICRRFGDRLCQRCRNKPWLGQGIRFGILIWLILAVPSFFIAYAVQPVPTILMVKQVLFEGVDKVLLGSHRRALSPVNCQNRER